MRTSTGIVAAVLLAVALAVGYRLYVGRTTADSPSSIPPKAAPPAPTLTPSPVPPTSVSPPASSGTPTEESELKQKILALFMEKKLPAHILVKRLHELAGDDPFPILMSFVLDPATPRREASNMLAHLITAARCGGFLAYLDNISDGVIDGDGTMQARDPRFIEPLTTIVTDPRYSAGIRAAALNALNGLQAGDPATKRALNLHAIDLRELPGIQATGLRAAHGFHHELDPSTRQDLVARALAVAKSSTDGETRALALLLLADMKVDVDSIDYLQGYASDPSPASRQARLIGFAGTATRSDVAVSRLVEAYYAEPDSTLKEFALSIIAARPGVFDDTRNFYWIAGELRPSLSPLAAKDLIGFYRVLASEPAGTGPAAERILASVVEDTSFSDEVRHYARQAIKEAMAWRKNPPPK